MGRHETTPKIPSSSDPATLKARGERLAEARRVSNMSQEDVAKALGVEKDTVSRWERGKNDAAHGFIEKLTDLYGVSLEWLSGRALHKTGLKPGYTIVDSRALERLRQAAAQGDTLESIDDLLRLPGADIAWDVPQDVTVVDGRTAQKLHLEIQQHIETLKRNTR